MKRVLLVWERLQPGARSRERRTSRAVDSRLKPLPRDLRDAQSHDRETSHGSEFHCIRHAHRRVSEKQIGDA